jgi:hypothetical protein
LNATRIGIASRWMRRLRTCKGAFIAGVTRPPGPAEWTRGPSPRSPPGPRR